MIHLSSETAKLLVDAGKSDWVQPRENLVTAKGKGEIQTYWLTLKKKEKGPSALEGRSAHSGTAGNSDSRSTSSRSSQDEEAVVAAEKVSRLIDWNVQVLKLYLKKIVALRNPTNHRGWMTKTQSISDIKVSHIEGTTVLDEVMEVIPLASTVSSEYKQDPESVELGDAVERQLEDFVTAIAGMYHNNPFHSFEHASHVTMSVSKLLSRIVTPDASDYHELNGVASDPLIHFACTLAALIHDVDHPGVPNAQLVKENVEIAEAYGGKSVAEQNSVDLSWDLLMEPMYKELRGCIYTNQEELDRFRQLVVNSVMATDIVDRELGELRKNRWKKAFEATVSEVDKQEDLNRKATIVIEHLIQASDVAHTMQHWHVYRKWNERLFHEQYKAYCDGRAEKNPADVWYDGEIGFFDFYIIPLAKKLKECGVFGVSSDEYLSYATKNREEWEERGRYIVEEMVEKYRKNETT